MDNKNICIVINNKNEKKTIANALRELFSSKEDILLSEAESIRFIEIQILISNERKMAFSFEGLRVFLLKAMNYSGFQLEEDEDIRFKKFLSVVTDEEILALYDAQENYDEKNIRSIDRFINTSEVGRAYGMHINENGCGILPNIIEYSRKKLAKTLLDRKTNKKS